MPLANQYQNSLRPRGSRNRTITTSQAEVNRLRSRLLRAEDSTTENCVGRTILGDFSEVLDNITQKTVDLLILDPPYNLYKKFGTSSFSRLPINDYTVWLESVIKHCLAVLKPSATVYICGDWLTSVSIFEAASKHLTVRNRITWEREKGRGALSNWKNSSEDIWFCTVSDEYTFNVNNIKLRRQVNAPYTDNNGDPKDWVETQTGKFRNTFPSNLWTDITIPFWSMPENTDHPTQKSEKLIAKLILASSNQNDIVLDPFLGSGTSSVVAKKLGRNFIGIELNEEYALLAEKRLLLAEQNRSIQGYEDNVFWERNTLNKICKTKSNVCSKTETDELFPQQRKSQLDKLF